MLAAAMVLAVAVGCGDDDEGSGTSAPPATSAAAPLALTDRVCEIPGLVPVPPPATPVASADDFAALGSQSVEDTAAFAAAYREHGFEEGLYQQMQPDPPGTTGGLCTVIRFADAAGANADVEFEVAQQEAFAEDDNVPFAPFEVPGIPGARGFQRGADDASHGHNVVFPTAATPTSSASERRPPRPRSATTRSRPPRRCTTGSRAGSRSATPLR